MVAPPRLTVTVYILTTCLWMIEPCAGQSGLGEVAAFQKISSTEGSFSGPLMDGDEFGEAVADLGDLNGDGVGDIAVGAHLSDDGGTNHGSVWILFLNADRTVGGHQKISASSGGFQDQLDDHDTFGFAVATLNDLDQDGVMDIAVSAPGDDDGGSNRGAVWILFLHSDGTVKKQQKISSTTGSFSGPLEDNDQFGWALSSLGDLDRDGHDELAVGAYQDDDGGTNRGAIWILSLNGDGTVRGHQKISSTSGGFSGSLDDTDELSDHGMATLPDMDGDGVPELAVGTIWDDDGGTNRGAVWLLFLNADGTVKSHQKISSIAGGFTGPLQDGDNFGSSIAALGDIDGDGLLDISVGARRDDDGGDQRGAVWILFLNADGTVKGHQKISDLSGSFDGILEDRDWFGWSAVRLPGSNPPVGCTLAIGANLDDDGGNNRGAVWLLSLCGPHSLRLNGNPQAGSPVSFTITGADDQIGFQALVLLSCAGIDGFPLPAGDGRTVPLTFDACTSLGLSLALWLSGTVDASGSATTPTLPFPSVSPGITAYAAAVTIDRFNGAFGSITSPISFTTQ